MAIGNFVPYDYVLLTGAGFSYPFGGFLANEFWERLFRRTQVQARPKVRALVLGERSFENALAQVRTDPTFDKEDVSALESAVMEVFASMDADIAQTDFWRDQPANVYGFQEFLQRFQCPTQGSSNAGFIFTLNQDLAVERHWYNFNHWGHHPALPGIVGSLAMGSQGRSWFSTHVGPLDPSLEVAIPDEFNLELDRRTNYVKLHGSLNWRTASGERALVIGSEKTQQIERLPILSTYNELFERVLMTPNRRLTVTGYSFQDEHINTSLNMAARDAGLVVHIWDPFVHDLMQRIQTRPECVDLAYRVEGFWSGRLHEVFPGNQAKTSEWREMQEKFFQVRFPPAQPMNF